MARKVKCKYCNRLYPTVIDSDYTGACGRCEELSINEQIKIRMKRIGYM